jgi:surface carbohydrate biosynthesis protein
MIYDRSGSEAIIEYLQNEIVHVMDTRGESLNLSVLITTLLAGKTSKTAYFETYLNCVDPDVILTFIDNDPAFYTLKKIKPSVILAFIQNGYRGEYTDIFELLKNQQEYNTDYEVDYMFVFGKAIAEKYSRYIKGQTIEIGSFLNNRSIKLPQQKNNSVLFISQYRTPPADLYSPLMFRYEKPITWEQFFYPEKCLLPFLFNYCKTNGLQLTVLGNTLTEHKKEHEYFTTLLGNENWLFISKEINNCSYSLLDKFEFIVFVDSTMGYEAFARGNKTAAFCLRGKILETKGHNFGWPLDLSENGPFWSNTNSTEEFNRVMNFITSVTDNEWNCLLQKNVRSLIECDPGNRKFQAVMKKLNISSN